MDRSLAIKLSTLTIVNLINLISSHIILQQELLLTLDDERYTIHFLISIDNVLIDDQREYQIQNHVHILIGLLIIDMHHK